MVNISCTRFQVNMVED